MKLVLTLFVVVSCVMMHEVMGMFSEGCQIWGESCSVFDSQANCCNGYTCKHWNLEEGKCKRDNDNDCVRRGEECGLFKWCCGDMDCQKNMWGKYECRN